LLHEIRSCDAAARGAAFFKRLAGVNTNPVDARALQFTILTGARTDEVIGGQVKPPRRGARSAKRTASRFGRSTAAA
jgi:hypothetical protein